MKILQNSDKQLVVAMKDSITILSDDKTLVSVDKEIVCAAAIIKRLLIMKQSSKT